MIKLSGIRKTFGKGSPNEIRILDNFNLEVMKGDFIVVVGSNGSGKTTLLNLIAGTVKPDSGSITFEGNDITGLKDFNRSKWIARIFQNPLAGTAPDLTVLENFRLASQRTKPKGLITGTGNKFRALVKEKISVLNLGLENKLEQSMGSLSGGQRQALSLLMAIMDDTKILLLDEPTAALDPKTSLLILELAKKVINEYGLTAIMVTHQISDIIEYGNRVIQMKEGRIIRDIHGKDRKLFTMNEVYEWFNH